VEVERDMKEFLENVEIGKGKIEQNVSKRS